MKVILILSRIISPLAWLGLAVLLGFYLMIPFELRRRHISEYLQYGEDFHRWASTNVLQSPIQINWWGITFWGLIIITLICGVPELIYRSRVWLKLRSVKKGGCVKCGCISNRPVENCPNCKAPMQDQSRQVQHIHRRMKWTNVLQGLVICLCGWVMVTGLVLRIIGEITEHPIP